MLRIAPRLTSALCLLTLACAMQASEPNTLTPEEAAAGWQLLFDGSSYANWTGMKGEPVPKDYWAIEDGTIRTVPGQSRDLVTTRPFDNFELTFDVKILADGNSGVKYLVQQEWLSPHWAPDQPDRQKEGQRLAAVGHEYQVLDDATLKGKAGWEKESMGSFYLLYAPTDKQQSAFGEWNTCRVVVNGTHVEHWLNGDKILDYELGTPELLELVQETKFHVAPGYGKKAAGYIVLTHHNSPAWFRNIKIRELD